MSKRIADGIRDSSGFWKHGHTYQVWCLPSPHFHVLISCQAHPIACAASLAVQKVLVEEDLLANARKQGEYLSSLLRQRLQSPNSIAAPYIFDIRGSGCWWGIEFDFEGPGTRKLDLKGTALATTLQQRAMEKGLIIMGMSGTASLDGSKGDCVLLSPAYNISKEQVEAIVDIFVATVEEVLAESFV